MHIQPPCCRLARLALLLLGLGSCRVDQESSMIDILGAVAPDDACKFAAENAPLPGGLYDPLADGSGFKLVLALRNNLPTQAEEPSLLDGTVNIRPRANGVSIQGFEACWAQMQGSLSAFGAAAAGNRLDCSSLPGQSATLAASGSIDPGGTDLALTTVTVLTGAHLQQLFGRDFAPTAIPVQGAQSQVQPDGSSLMLYNPALADPADPNSRSPAWGANYPTTVAAPVLVQLRAVLTRQSGDTTYSGWFTFPITVCPGCVTSSCGPLVQKSCDTVCSDGSPCSSDHTCTIGGVVSACPQAPRFSGSTAYLRGLCLPAQALTPADCTTNKVGC